MLPRQNLKAPDRRISVGLSGLIIGIVLESVGPRLPALAGGASWDGFVHGVAVMFIALGIFLSASGAADRIRRRGPGAP